MKLLVGYVHCMILKIDINKRFSLLDLDSIISSIVFAYLQSIHWTHNPSDISKKYQSRILPIINIPKNDLPLRRDVEFVFSKANISSENLIFIDDLSKIVKNNFKFDLILVDHNNPTGLLSKSFNEIIGIIDHHVDEGLFIDSINRNFGPRIIEKSGSCSSLIVKYWVNEFNKISANVDIEFKNISELILSPLIIDTSCLKHRVEESDTKAYNILKKIVPNQFNIEKYFDDLQNAKTDIKGMKSIDILRKDYKEWNITTNKSKNELRIGISSIVKLFDWIYNEHKTFDESVLKLGNDLNLDLFLIMASDAPRGKFQRQIKYFAISKKGTEALNHLVNGSKQELELESITLPENIEVKALNGHPSPLLFQQKNTKASRKLVAPLTQNILHSQF